MAKPQRAAAQRFVSSCDYNGTLEVTVLHSDAAMTIGALRTATQLTQNLGVQIRLLVLQVVPYPLSLERPDVSLDFIRRTLHELASEAKVDVQVDLRIGRDRRELLETSIKPASIILLGPRRRWWPTLERRVAERLHCSVIEVIPQTLEG